MKRTVRAFTHTFGPACGSYGHTVPAGTICDYHHDNACWYVRPSEIDNGMVRHDATYYGIRVSEDNLV